MNISNEALNKRTLDLQAAFCASNNWEPITDDSGTKEHRGRRYPICQCPCRPCFSAWVCLLTEQPNG